MRNLLLNNYQLDPNEYPPKWNNPNSKIDIEISTIINYSESKEKVIKAVKNIFPDIEDPIEKDSMIFWRFSSETVLFNFCKQIFDQKILDVARKCVIDGIKTSDRTNTTDKTVFYLNKQIAYANKVNFSTSNDSPLGPIIISIKNTDLELFIDNYFPKFEWFSKK